MDNTEIIRNILIERLNEGNDNAFYILTIDEILEKFKFWKENFPLVKPFYAVKANSNNHVLKLMKFLGANFDCASMGEIKKVLEVGVDKNRIIYANPLKQISHLKYAAKNGIEKVTFDSYEELLKIKKFHPKAKIVMRIQHDSLKAEVIMGMKFGCHPITEAPELIKKCKELELCLIGVSFHSGTRQLDDCEVHANGMRVIKNLFTFAKNFGFKLNFVDIGGGFSGTNMELVRKIANNVQIVINECFNDDFYEIIAEPGTFFTQTSMKLLCGIHSKKIDGNQIKYCLNEGILRSFLEIPLSNVQFNFSIFKKKNSESHKKFPSILYGESLSPFDKIAECEIEELSIGDWLIFHDMGNYNSSHMTTFNGFEETEIIPILLNEKNKNILKNVKFAKL